MHTTEVLFKFLKFLSLWLLMANKACKISKKPALKKLNSHSSLDLLLLHLIVLKLSLFF